MIRVYKSRMGIIIEKNEECFKARDSDWDLFINKENLYEEVNKELQKQTSIGRIDWLKQQKILAPIGSQEVWAAGVTYLRSKVARMEESEESGGATFYDKVYEAERPELFFKANSHNVVGAGDYVRIRKDSTWNVPEPELTLVITSKGEIVGYTIGNDMSSRSIEGENPLYLPQAKIYKWSASIGPCVLLTGYPIPGTTTISMSIERNKQLVFKGDTTINQMKRSHMELVSYLYRESEFPAGCYLMTGTCVVPANEFTLKSKDIIKISIDDIGTLTNTVE